MNTVDSPVLYIGCLLALAGIILFGLGKKHIALFALCMAAAVIRIYMAHLDPFLNDWDEKYHALVARNMMDNPFVPLLKKGINIPYDYKAWCCNEVWLHKQPLFMWQMALSMQLFGVSEYAIRYPDVLMGALMVLMVYRVGKLLSSNDTIGFMAAMFLCFSNYQLELTSGYHGMDHNDLTFGFYVLASIWAYTEYIKEGKLKWIVLICVFAGCAVLNKWLTGLLVFAGWGINILATIKSKDARQQILHLLSALGIAILVFLPWQLYILSAFPKEAQYELSYNSKHLFKVVEGHEGSIWFYWNNLWLYFGKYIWWFMPAGLLIMLFYKPYRNPYGRAIAGIILTVFIFFSFMVRSKLQSYFFVVAPLGYICMAVALVHVLQLVKLKSSWQPVAAIAFCYVLLYLPQIRRQHHPENEERLAKIHNTRIYKTVREELPEDVTVVTNLNAFADVEFMFYNKGIVAYHYNPTEAETEQFIKDGVKMATFQNRKYYVSPLYIWFYPRNYIIWKELK